MRLLSWQMILWRPDVMIPQEFTSKGTNKTTNNSIGSGKRKEF
jgi:hypothetical protein